MNPEINDKDEKDENKFVAVFYSKRTPYRRLPLIVIAGWCFVIYIQVFFNHTVVSAFSDVNASANYGAILSATTALLGFIIAAATIFLTIPHEDHLARFAEAEMLQPLFGTFVNAIIFLSLALISSIFGLLNFQNYSVEVLTLFLFTLSLAYIAQSVRILALVAQVVLHRIEKTAKLKRAEDQRKLNEKLGPKGTV